MEPFLRYFSAVLCCYIDYFCCWESSGLISDGGCSCSELVVTMWRDCASRIIVVVILIAIVVKRNNMVAYTGCSTGWFVSIEV